MGAKMLGSKLFLILLSFHGSLINAESCSNNDTSDTVNAYMQDSFQETTSEVSYLVPVIMKTF